MVICSAKNLGSVIDEVNRFEVLDIAVTVVINCFKLFFLRYLTDTYYVPHTVVYFIQWKTVLIFVSIYRLEKYYSK